MRKTVSCQGALGIGNRQWMTAGRGIVHSEMPEQEAGLLWGGEPDPGPIAGGPAAHDVDHVPPTLRLAAFCSSCVCLIVVSSNQFTEP